MLLKSAQYVDRINMDLSLSVAPFVLVLILLDGANVPRSTGSPVETDVTVTPFSGAKATVSETENRHNSTVNNMVETVALLMIIRDMVNADIFVIVVTGWCWLCFWGFLTWAFLRGKWGSMTSLPANDEEKNVIAVRRDSARYRQQHS